jgi:predicted GNAT family acetyltransferase
MRQPRRRGRPLPSPNRNPRRAPRSIQRIVSTISHDESAHCFTTVVDGSRARLDYTLAGNVMTITHTRVPPAIRGRGVAAELMQAALSAARAAGWSVTPACSYAVAYMARHAQASDEKRHVDDLLDEALEESFPASDSPSVGGSN